MLVRFLSDRRKEIVTGFIGLIPVQGATGEKMFNSIDEEIKRCGQSIANCIAFAICEVTRLDEELVGHQLIVTCA